MCNRCFRSVQNVQIRVGFISVLKLVGSRIVFFVMLPFCCVHIICFGESSGHCKHVSCVCFDIINHCDGLSIKLLFADMLRWTLIVDFAERQCARPSHKP